MSGKSAIIFGATGAVGKPLLSELLSSSHYSQIHAFVRRPFKEASDFKNEAKLQEHIIDFEKLIKETGDANTEAQSIKNVDAEAVYITLGTTRALAGSAANFVRIDREYVLAAAKAAMTDKADENQRVIYCSSSGSNSKSSFLYMQSKGLTEEGLAGLGYSDCILFKPAYLAGANRERTRYAEKVFGALMTNVVGKLSDNVDIQVTDVAKAMLVAGTRGTAGLTNLGAGDAPKDSFKRSGDSKVTYVNNTQAKKLAKEI